MVPLPWPLALAVSVVVWVVVSLVVGYWAARLPVERLQHAGPVTRLRRFERGGQWYVRWLHIKAWKDVLPEAGGFWGGLSKSRLPAPDQGGLSRFAAENLRAERTHWVTLATTPVHALWCPWWLFAAMVGFGLVGNLPCIAIVRYNRARVVAALDRRRARRPRS